jgi:hypothetical protein
MRFLKPLLAGAALLAIAVPTLASADPYYGDHGLQYHRDGGYDRHQSDAAYRRDDQGGRDYADRGYDYRDSQQRDHSYRDNGYRWGHRHYWRTDRHWERYHSW